MNVKWFWHQCVRHEYRLSLLAAGVLPEAERKIVEAHLARCGACQARLEELRQVTSQLESLGRHLPKVEPPASLRGRWQKVVCEHPNTGPQRPPAPTIARPDWLDSWLSGGRLAWGTVGACWILILFFHVSAPEAPKPAMAAAPVSLKEVRLVLERARPQPWSDIPGWEPRQDLPRPAPANAPRSQRPSAIETT